MIQLIENQPLLTVIIPCYNVELYVDKCISSIVNQTYPNLEILLINDGSTDSTGKICDEWQKRDPRIRVIHKQNEGSSFARRTGVDNTTAEYITFVDSDDWIDANMYTEMMSALLITDSDIADCDLCFMYEEDGRVVHRVDERDGTFITMGREESVILLLSTQSWRTSFCTKIFKRKLFEHIEFPKRNKLDDFVIQYLYHQVSKTVLINRAFYYYFKRSGSICHPTDLQGKIKNYSERSDAYYERYLFVKQYREYHKAMPFVKYYTIYCNLSLLHAMIKHPQYFDKEQFRIKIEQLRSINFTREDNLPRGRKVDMYLLKISPKLFWFIRLLYFKAIQVKKKYIADNTAKK